LGTGAGVMSNFLTSQLGDKLGKLVTVDNSEDMLKLAEKYFGFNPNSQNVESLALDAHKYVMNSNDIDKFDIIL